MKSEILAYLENIESRQEAKTSSAPRDVDAVATPASQKQAPLACLAKGKEKVKAAQKDAKERKEPRLWREGKRQRQTQSNGSSNWSNGWCKNR